MLYLPKLGDIVPCMEVAKESTTKEELCQCVAEIGTCDENHLPNSHTSENQYSDRFYKWMTCLGEGQTSHLRPVPEYRGPSASPDDVSSQGTALRVERQYR
ncbi:uncharacterized protein LOC135108561 isoform X3 [Scylla paramamosain]|uniref:uncharacterized protein LOC135108561 isoform X3 n=1 Tax=Scylla paramamosain TaxID=85552 RepID=UPI00308305CA